MADQYYKAPRHLDMMNTYSRKENIKKENTKLIRRCTKRRSTRIADFIKKADKENLASNFALTIVWHALATAGDRHEGHILGMQPQQRQEHFFRKMRTLAQRLSFKTAYFWVRSIGARMGEHLHIGLHWRHSAFVDLIKLMEATFGSDLDHEAKSCAPFYGRSHCRGWELKQIPGGISGAFRWGEYLASQRIKHYDSSSGRRMGFSYL